MKWVILSSGHSERRLHPRKHTKGFECQERSMEADGWIDGEKILMTRASLREYLQKIEINIEGTLLLAPVLSYKIIIFVKVNEKATI